MVRARAGAVLAAATWTSLLLDAADAFQMPPLARQGPMARIAAAGMRPLTSTAYPQSSAPEAAADSSAATPKFDYDWRLQWFPVGYVRDFEGGKHARPYGMSIFDEPLVVFRDEEGALHCVQDLCTHRAARLSEGIVEKGRLYCTYHGWEFNGRTGGCERIPQLAAGAAIPRAAALRVYPLAEREGIVWVWMGDDPWGEGAKLIKPVPTTPDDIDNCGDLSFVYQFAIDLPYDHSFLVENLIDPAHIPISHHATEGGGRRENAKALQFNVDTGTFGPAGFKAVVPNLFSAAPTAIEFSAPCVVRLRTAPEGKNGKPGLVFGAALHCVPMGQGRSRLLFMTYARRMPRLVTALFKLKPMWLRNLNSCKILEQDLGLITSQEDHFARTNQTLSQAYLPIATSDALVIQYRRWLDAAGPGMPYHEGFATNAGVASRAASAPRVARTSAIATGGRYARHVVLSLDTKRALRRIRVLRGAAGWVALALAAAAVGVGSRAVAAAAVGAVAATVAAARLEGLFYRRYERIPEI